MERLDREDLYQALIDAGYDDKGERQTIANKFVNKVYKLFKEEAEDIARAAYASFDEREKTRKALESFANTAIKIHDILEKGFDGCQQAMFQTIRAREVFTLYTALKRVGASEETCSYALYGFLTGKELTGEDGEPKPVPDLDKIKKELDSLTKNTESVHPIVFRGR